jgi:NADPH2 dehydrogenase
MVSLLDPLKVGRLELRNRIVMAPMHFGKATKDGQVTEALINHYANCADNLGLLIAEATTVSEANRWFHLLRIDSDRFVPGLEKLVKTVHQSETLMALQLIHLGCMTKRQAGPINPLGPPSTTIAGAHMTYSDNESPQAMTRDDIVGVIEDFSKAAHRACEAGFDAVEINGAHGRVFSQFLSPLRNERDDEYGGPLENRARLSVQVVRRIRKELGGYPVLFRLGAEDMLPGGLTLDEGVSAAEMIVDAGADIVDVSGGLIGHLHPENKGPGFFVAQAAAVKKAVDVPVIGVGGINTPEEADEIIRSGKVDLVAIGRAIAKEPDWASKAIETLTRKQ